MEKLKSFLTNGYSVPTEQYKGNIEDAITRLKATVSVYQDLAHPSLIRFVKAEEIGTGFAVVLDWVDAVCAQRMYPTDYKIFRQLPIETKNCIFEEILAFHDSPSLIHPRVLLKFSRNQNEQLARDIRNY